MIKHKVQLRKSLLNSWQNSHGLFNVDFRYFGKVCSNLFNKPLLVTLLGSVRGYQTNNKKEPSLPARSMPWNNWTYTYKSFTALLQDITTFQSGQVLT